VIAPRVNSTFTDALDASWPEEQSCYSPCVRFKIGDRVQRVRDGKDDKVKDITGIVTAVIPDGKGVDEFTLYDIKVDAKNYTFYGSQLRLVPEGRQ
jgi:hypothetical protein